MPLTAPGAVLIELMRRFGSGAGCLHAPERIVRTFISFPAGVARMPLLPFIVFSTAGALLWSILLVFVGEKLGENWTQIRHALQPLDTLILVAVVGAVVLFIWWRLGKPGWKRGKGVQS